MVPLQTWPIATVHTRQWIVDFLLFLSGCVSGQARPHFPGKHGNDICLVLTLYLRILISHLTYRVWLLQLFQIDKMVNSSKPSSRLPCTCVEKSLFYVSKGAQRRKTDDILPISKHHKPPTCLFPPRHTGSFLVYRCRSPFSQETPNIPAISPLLQNQEPPTPMCIPPSHSSLAPAPPAPGLRLRLLPLLPPLAPPPPLPPLAPPPCFTPGGGLTNAKSTCTV